MIASNAVDNHRMLLMKKTAEAYLVCDLHHQAECHNRATHDASSERSNLTKTVLLSRR